MLATNEIGQFFNVETHEPLGTLNAIRLGMESLDTNK